MTEKTSFLPAIVLIVLVLVAGGATGAYLYAKNLPKGPSSLTTVAVGDNVTVNYIGTFGSGPEQGKVFDTSLYAVANNNAVYPKALQYHLRGENLAKNYTPLAVHVGGNTPSSGYSYDNLSFIQVVTGFWQGLVGLPVNETHAVVVPPALGYGPSDPACQRTLPLKVQVPVFQTLSGTEFTKLYPSVLATTGSSFVDPTYGWTTEILSANATSVSIENVVYVGEMGDRQGWNTTVTNVTSTSNDSGLITVQNDLTPAQAGHLAGSTTNGLCTSSSNGDFIITAVNYTSGTFTEDFDQEVVGQTLIFQVTIVAIYAPVATTV
jgi:FKBP-type peptidyl-prolyl cis-trans isomerase 2